MTSAEGNSTPIDRGAVLQPAPTRWVRSARRLKRRATARCDADRRAFTLIEVLLALALFSISGLVLAAAYVTILNSIENVRLDQALEDELALVRTQVLLQPDLDEIESGGDIPTVNYGPARWSATVVPSERIADLFRVELEIELEGDGERIPKRTLSQTLWLLRPDWSEPTDRDNLRAQRRKEIDEAKRYRPL